MPREVAPALCWEALTGLPLFPICSSRPPAARLQPAPATPVPLRIDAQGSLLNGAGRPGVTPSSGVPRRK